MLNTSESPRHPDVTGTPTVLFYKDGKLLKKLKGIGTEQTLQEDFARHIGKVKPADGEAQTGSRSGVVAPDPAKVAHCASRNWAVEAAGLRLDRFREQARSRR